MAYLDPASNPGSKPQRLSDKSCTWKENKNFGISCKLLTKKYICKKFFVSICNFFKQNH